MVPFSFGVALAVRMGVTLPVSVRRTKVIVLAVLISSIVVFGLVTVVVYFMKDSIVALFTKDSEVEELASEVWIWVSFFNFNVALFGILCGVATGLGQQWTLGTINFLWLVSLFCWMAIVLLLECLPSKSFCFLPTHATVGVWAPSYLLYHNHSW